MSQLAVLSGKGGTGKTCVTAALAVYASEDGPVGLVDADVDASNLPLLLSPDLRQRSVFRSGFRFSIETSRCNGCGRCAEACRFDAVRTERTDGSAALPRYRIDEFSCEGCGSCWYECPMDAVVRAEAETGVICRSSTPFGPLFHAHLKPGAENSGKLISVLRREARDFCARKSITTLLIDGPPGIGCPAISASTGADLALVVAEPGVSGMLDMQRALETCGHFGIQTLVTINRSDLSRKNAEKIRDYCDINGIPMLPEIPYDPAMTQAVSRGLPVPEFSPGSPSAQVILKIWRAIQGLLS